MKKILVLFILSSSISFANAGVEFDEWGGFSIDISDDDLRINTRDTAFGQRTTIRSSEGTTRITTRETAFGTRTIVRGPNGTTRVTTKDTPFGIRTRIEGSDGVSRVFKRKRRFW